MTTPKLNKAAIDRVRDTIDAARGTGQRQLAVVLEVLLDWHERQFDLEAHLARQKTFSLATFGPGARTQGVCDHIRKELCEIEADPTDIMEWVDVIILAFDGAWRAGWEPKDIIAAIVEKQSRNEKRSWPDWRTADPNKAIEHTRTEGQP